MENSPISRVEFETLFQILQNQMARDREDLKETVGHGFSEVTARLDRMNGTQREHGDRLVVLESRYGKVSIAGILAILGLIIAAATAYAAFIG